MFHNVVVMVFVRRVRPVIILPFNPTEGEVDLTAVYISTAVVGYSQLRLLSLREVSVRAVW